MGWESDFLMCNYKQQNKTDDGGNHEENDDDDSQQVQQDETKIGRSHYTKQFTHQ